MNPCLNSSKSWHNGSLALLSHKEFQNHFIFSIVTNIYIYITKVKVKGYFIGAVLILKLFSLRNSYGLVAYYFCGGGNFVCCCHIHNPELPIKSVNIYEGI